MARTPKTKESVTAKVRAAVDEHQGQGMNLKTMLLVMAAALGVGGGGSVVGTRLSAPDPVTVQKTQEDVSAIKVELGKLNVTLTSLAQAAGNDKSEMERRFAEQQRAIDRISLQTERVRELDDLKRRVEALEKGGK